MQNQKTQHILSFLLLLLANTAFSQNKLAADALSKLNLNNKHEIEYIILDNDTLINILCTKIISSEFYNSELSASLLMQLAHNELDTLLN